MRSPKTTKQRRQRSDEPPAVAIQPEVPAGGVTLSQTRNRTREIRRSAPRARTYDLITVATLGRAHSRRYRV